MTALAALALAIWLYLTLAHDGFWLTRERDDRGLPPPPAVWPSVVAVIPARDEAEVVGEAVASLLAQDYPGALRLILVDDNSSDATADIARAAAAGDERLTILRGAPLPSGWTGKLWAVAQGIEAVGVPLPEREGLGVGGGTHQRQRAEQPTNIRSNSPRLFELVRGTSGRMFPPFQGGAIAYLLLTDADITHAPDTLRTLVTRAVGDRRVLVSLMARLRCESLAERALIPAFVLFFAMLYPFARINRRGRGIGGAAGGCMLVDRAALTRAGGVAAMRGALIDDCAFGALLKRQGDVWLGLTIRVRSIRRYDTAGSIAAMISRSAYAQLRYSPLLLAGTVAGLALTFAAPPLLALAGHGLARAGGIAAWALMALCAQPMLRFYRRSPLWGAALPAIAAFYAGCTLLSGWQHARGQGGMWKGRAQAALRP